MNALGTGLAKIDHPGGPFPWRVKWEPITVDSRPGIELARCKTVADAHAVCKLYPAVWT